MTWSEPIKEEWSDFVMVVSKSGFKSMNQFVNTISFDFYKNNYSKVFGKNTKFVTLDYSNDTEAILANKAEPFSNGQVLDEYELICSRKLFWQRIMKKRGMDF